MAKEKMSIEKKTILFYSGELLFFALVFCVIATLEILGVIGNREIMHIIFNWVTIFGATWMIVDFFWVIFSDKRRKKNSLLDKALLLPAAVYLITFDIICFTKASFVTLEFRRMMMAFVFYYFGAIYLFQGIYHYFFPVPQILEAIEEMHQEEEKQKLDAIKQQDTVVGEAKEETKESE